MKENYFLSQPHQPFFVLAFINAIMTMLLFMLSYKGIVTLTITPAFFHAYTLLFLVFTPAFLGFLFTTFPRFSGLPAIEKPLYLKVLGLFFIGTLLLLLGVVASTLLYKAGMIILFGGHIWSVKILFDIFKSSKMDEKHDTFWILLAMGFGLLSHLLFILGYFFQLPLYTLSVQSGIYLYLFMVAFSVAQRMVPFFSHCNVERNSSFLKVVFLLLVTHVIIESLYPHLSAIVDFALAYITAKEVFRWKLPFPNPNPLLWILHLALYWVPVAFIFGAMSNLVTLIDGTPFLFLDIHVLMLGFVFTILIGFGTRVTIGHSGNTMQTDKWVTLLFNWTQLVVVMRLFTSMAAAWGWNFMILFDISVTVWLLMFILWAIRFFPVLIKGKKLQN